jgi:hypothetical protein
VSFTQQGGQQHEPRAVRIYNLQDRGVEPCQSWHDSKRAGRLTHSRATAPTACKPVVDGQDGQRQPYHCFSYVTSIHFTCFASTAVQFKPRDQQRPFNSIRQRTADKRSLLYLQRAGLIKYLS